MIDPKLIERNKARLLEEKRRLEKLLSGVVSYPEFGSKEDENAAEVTQYETNLAEERDLEEKLHQVEQALLRIKNGTYGFCLAGGEEISTARLEALPEAGSCLEHQEA